MAVFKPLVLSSGFVSELPEGGTIDVTLVDATETQKGVVELATAAETVTGTDPTRAVHPSGLKHALDTKLDVTGGTVSGVVSLVSGVRFEDADGSNWAAFQAPATIASNVLWTLPDADGQGGQTLSTNGSGTLNWSTPSAGVSLGLVVALS